MTGRDRAASLGATKTLMVLGSMSSVGKSLVTTGLCRLFARRGVSVAPFKAQNLSNNAAVCGGGEIGRAQAVQAHAAGIEPSVEMNPVLIKPMAGSRGQLVVRGQPVAGATREVLWATVTRALDALRSEYDLVIIEGAGSPAELNLQDLDIVNMAIARYASSPCLLVGDIDRGGVFAQLLGTLWLLEETDRALVKALVVNKFRGIPELFRDGVRHLEERAGLPVLGVLPWMGEVGIAEEDATTVGERGWGTAGAPEVVVIALPHISNFDDLDPLRVEPGIRLRYAQGAAEIGRPAAIILPGSKNTLHDLDWLRHQGLDEIILRHAREGGVVVGLCGGYQMLGVEVADDAGVESAVPRRARGLGLLPVRTALHAAKTVTRTRATLSSGRGFLAGLAGTQIEGYEIHVGASVGGEPLARITGREGAPVSALDGAVDATGRVLGTYLHGLFDNDAFRGAWLRVLGATPSPVPFAQTRTLAYDRLADLLERSLDLPLLDRIVAGAAQAP